jgi:hypothetical protein
MLAVFFSTRAMISSSVSAWANAAVHMNAVNRNRTFAVVLSIENPPKNPGRRGPLHEYIGLYGAIRKKKGIPVEWRSAPPGQSAAQGNSAKNRDVNECRLGKVGLIRPTAML